MDDLITMASVFITVYHSTKVQYLNPDFDDNNSIFFLSLLIEYFYVYLYWSEGSAHFLLQWRTCFFVRAVKEVKEFKLNVTYHQSEVWDILK